MRFPLDEACDIYYSLVHGWKVNAYWIFQDTRRFALSRIYLVEDFISIIIIIYDLRTTHPPQEIDEEVHLLNLQIAYINDNMTMHESLVSR